MPSSPDNATPARMPVVFAGHGSPMNAIEDNPYSRAWETVGRSLPRPKAILCVSAHWETRGVQVTAMERPQTIYDFYGFPRPLYQVQYPAPGSPELAAAVQQTVTSTPVGLDTQWGLDHGAWSVLRRMFPAADIPVIQFSLEVNRPPAYHYALGQELRRLRQQGVLILGSGNIVHNLRMIQWEGGAYDWALEFDQRLRQLIESGDDQAVVNYDQLGAAARLAIPTNEHFLPLLYILGLRHPADEVQFFADEVVMGSISMRGVILNPVV